MAFRGNNAAASKEYPVELKSALCLYSTGPLRNYKQHLKVHSFENPFKCPDCPFTTKWKQAVKQHAKNVHQTESRPFPCQHPGCDYTAKQKGNLKIHEKAHSDENSLFCSQPNCHFSTKYQSVLLLHTQRHTGEKPYVFQFESCSYAAATSSALLVHSRTHTKEQPFKCHERNCEFSSAQKANLRRHQLTHPPKEGEEHPSFQCPLCEYSGKSKDHLSKHLKSHTLEKLFKCDEPNCNYEAKRISHLKTHKLVHSDEKPFFCSAKSCEFRCKLRNNLSEHLKTHREERWYKCELCLYRGKTRGAVARHLRTVHSVLRPFKCPEPNCVYAAKTTSNLSEHLLTHKTKKEYVCLVLNCEYKTVSESRLKLHQENSHNPEKRFKCPLCNYNCNWKSSLTTHFMTHTKEEPYICKEEGCEYRAKQGGLLKKHHQKSHPHLFN